MGTQFNPEQLQSGYHSRDLLNDLFEQIRDDLENKVDRDGTLPNAMNNDLDLGDFQLLNVAPGVRGTDGVNLNQVQNLITSIATTIISSGGSGQGQTTGDPITFNFGVATGSQGTANRTVFDLTDLFGTTGFLGLTVIIDGVVQIPGLAYAVDGTVVTLTESVETTTDLMFIFGDLSPTPVLPNILADNIGYDIGGYYDGLTLASDIFLKFVTCREFFLPANLDGSNGHAGTAASASTTFDVQKNGSNIGTVVFAGGSSTPSFTLSADTNFAVGDRLSVVCPASPDATLADISITIKGTVGQSV